MQSKRQEVGNYLAPLSRQDVEHVVAVPRSHLLQTSTHCANSFELYGEYSFAAQDLTEPVTSSSRHPTSVRAKAMTIILVLARANGSEAQRGSDGRPLGVR